MKEQEKPFSEAMLELISLYKEDVTGFTITFYYNNEYSFFTMRSANELFE